MFRHFSIVSKIRRVHFHPGKPRACRSPTRMMLGLNQELRERASKENVTRNSRVTLKVNISYKDHGMMIGKGGQVIRTIMDETLTHVHFPDSNRLSESGKSNQVSITGLLENVEKARLRVRLLVPLKVSFAIPNPNSVFRRNNSKIEELEHQFGVQVSFSSKPRSTIILKGVSCEPLNLVEAAKQLMKLVHGNDQLAVRTYLQIPAQSMTENAPEIMQQTNTNIKFPFAQDDVNSSKCVEVKISGLIENVLQARQKLLEKLPIVLVFNEPKNRFDEHILVKIMADHNVKISTNTNDHKVSIFISGCEKNIKDVYDAHHQLIKLMARVQPLNFNSNCAFESSRRSENPRQMTQSHELQYRFSDLYPDGFFNSYQPTTFRCCQEDNGSCSYQEAKQQLHDDDEFTKALLIGVGLLGDCCCGAPKNC